MQCPVCEHDITLLHDGEGVDEEDPFICRAVGCDCSFIMEQGDPVKVLVDRD